MGDHEQFYIPQSLDEPDRILIFPPDEAIVLFTGLLLGVWFEFMLYGFLGGVAAVWMLKRLKGSEQPNIAIYAMYWFLPTRFLGIRLMRLQGTPPSHIRHLIG